MSKKIPGKLIFKGLVGSHAYGLNIETSDKDYKGIYIQSPESVLEHGYIPQVEINKDEIYYEIGRFLDLAISANPTILELLFLPNDCIIYQHESFKKLKFLRRRFLTKKCKNSFGGYAKQQIKKASGLDKKMNWGDEFKTKKSVIDFCWVIDKYKQTSIPFIDFVNSHYGATMSNPNNYCLKKLEHMKDMFLCYFSACDWCDGIATKNANELKINNNIPTGLSYTSILYFNRQDYSQYCKKYKEYQTWLKERNTARYVEVEKHGQHIDGKNMMHCIRLLEMAKEISKGEELKVKRPNREFLLAIRQGKVNLKTLLTKAESDLKSININFNKSKLPDDVNKKLLRILIKGIRKRIYNEQNNR